MGSLFRSETMSLCQLFLQVESSYESIKSLGELGLVQFRDLNPDVNAFQRKFIGEVKRCDEMERRVRLIESEIKRESIPILNVDYLNTPVPAAKEMIILESKLERKEIELKEVIKSSEALNHTWQELNELKHVLLKSQGFFEETEAAVVTHGPASVSVTGGLAHGSITDDTLLANFAVTYAAGRQTGTLTGDSVFTDAPSSAVSGKKLSPKVSSSSLSSVGIAISSGSFKIGELHLSFITGVIAREKFAIFERMLWRVCRGNVYLKSSEIEEPVQANFSHSKSSVPVFKIAFIIFFQGDQLKSKVRKICEGCRATLYPCPESADERSDMLQGVNSRMNDLATVINQTYDHRHRILVSSAREIKTWFAQIVKIKSIYTTLNLFNFDFTQKCLIGEFWCPDADMNIIHSALADATRKSGSTVPSIINRVNNTQMDHSLPPPTFNRTNKVTAGFQAIVDAYGVADYTEVNPVTFTIITFPFLFAVMFGDTGHGFIMFLFALFLVWKEEKIIAMRTKDEIFNTFFSGRYIILLMGAFSMYTGALYNDVFGRSVNLFGSAWKVTSNEGDWVGKVNLTTNNVTIILDPKYHYIGEPYWFGVDPVWNLASNKIIYLNSYKMKLSVILGVGQMFFGTCLSFFNHVHFQKPLNIICEFVPQIIFLLAIFGYMNSLIVAKWLMYTSETSGDAPSVLLTLISMFMLGSKDNFFRGQKNFQTVLLLLALICVPWMLFVKPIVLYCRHKETRGKQGSQALLSECNAESTLSTPSTSESNVARSNGTSPAKSTDTSNGNTSTVITLESEKKIVTTDGGAGHHGHSGEFDFGDIMVHQAIHTIEYCLGSISHTASYLRLWALSLAHSQLSEVLWDRVMKIGLEFIGTAVAFQNALALVIIFLFWSSLSVAILILMEGLSAFLHALRLHWVEFQSKFYSGSGVAFVPFSLRKTLEEADAAAAVVD